MAEINSSKICTKCQVEKPAREFHKSAVWCKLCVRAYDAAYSAKNRDRRRQTNKEYYAKNKNRIKRQSKFYRENNADKISASLTIYREKNKEKIKVYHSEYFKANKKRISERKKHHRLANVNKYRDRDRNYYIRNYKKRKESSLFYHFLNREKRLEYQRRYQKENCEKLSKRHREYYILNKKKIKDYYKKYLKSERGRWISKKHNHIRRARKLGVEYERFNPKEIFERDRYVCQICGRKTRPDFKNKKHDLYPNLDHIIPISKGGSHTRLNTQCLCRKCNATKSNSGKGDQLRLF